MAAIVGIGCRFPGADSHDELWRVLINGENHVVDIPNDRMNMGHYFSEDKTVKGKTYTRKAGIISNILDWDNETFGINEMEAERMDPQHKLALEVCFQALEDAGLTTEQMKNKNTAVYMGSMYNEYSGLAGNGVEFIDNYYTSGSSNCMLANRLSYFFDLKGPSVQLDTACSTGLQAVHFGNQSILTGESDMAICGGTNIIISPTSLVGLAKSSMSSAVGQCQAFSDLADGYVRGEGCGIVILKNYDMAMKDGDKIYGVITTMANSDGRETTPITAPSSEMQTRLIQHTLAKAELEPGMVQYVEMHGTGTPVGDPAEVSSVGKTYGQAYSQQSSKCPVGSIKTNIGHLEAASGIAGLIKVILMMQHGQFVPTVIFGKINENLNLDANGLRVTTSVEDWPCLGHNGGQWRIAAVNSFGFGGSNVHAIVKSIQFPSHCFVASNNGSQCIVFNGKDSEAIRSSIWDTIERLQNDESPCFTCMSRTSVHKRTPMRYRRAVFVFNDKDKVVEDLRNIAKNTEQIGREIKNRDVKPNIIFVFSGMGTHWLSMGQGLYKREPVYKQTILKLREFFNELSDDIDILKCINGECDLENPRYVQPALFACQVALFHLWVSKGILPNQIIGHSVGEVAAAYASGRITLRNATFVIYHRGVALSKLYSASQSDGDQNATGLMGSMYAIGNLAVDKVEEILRSYSNVSVAAYNSSSSCTLSGTADQLDSVVRAIKEEHNSALVKKLSVSVAYHSSSVDSVLSDLQQELRNRNLPETNGRAKYGIVSTVTGKEATEGDFATADYWRRNVRQPVLFMEGIKTTLDGGTSRNVFVEIGPKPALRRYINEITTDFEYLASMGQNNDDEFYENMAKAYELTMNTNTILNSNFWAEIAWEHDIFSHVVQMKIPRWIPQRKRLYKESNVGTAIRSGSLGMCPPVLKKDASIPLKFNCEVSMENTAHVFEHLFMNTAIVPGAMYLELARNALAEAINEDETEQMTPLQIRITFSEVFVAQKHKKDTLTVKIHTIDNDDRNYEFDITHGNILHACGSATRWQRTVKVPKLRIDLPDVKCYEQTLNHDECYERLESFGYKYGELYKAIQFMAFDDRESLVHLEVSSRIKHENAYSVSNTVIIDCVLQSAGLALASQFPQQERGQVMPYGIREVVIYNPLRSKLVLHTRIKDLKDTYGISDTTICDEFGNVLGSVNGIIHGVAGVFLNLDIHRYKFTSAWPAIGADQADCSTSTVGKQYLLITDSESPVSIEKYNNGECVAARVYVDESIVSQVRDDASNLDSVLNVNFDEHDTIVVNMCSKEIEECSGEDINEYLLNTCLLILYIIKRVLPTRKHKCFVLTRGVLLLQRLTSAAYPFSSIIGSALTGFCRSVKKEQMSFPLVLVDFSDESQIEIDRFHTEILQNADYSELYLNGNELHYGTMVAANNIVQEDQRIAKTCDAIQIMKNLRSNSISFNPVTTNSSRSHQVHASYISIAETDVHDMDEPVQGFDSIVYVDAETKGCRKMHICQHHQLTSHISWRNLPVGIPLDVFPCFYPSLSYWLLMWKTLKSIPSGGRLFIIMRDVPLMWNNVAAAVTELCGVQLVSSEDEATHILLIANQPSCYFKQLTCSNKRVFIIDNSTPLIPMRTCMSNIASYEHRLCHWSPDRVLEIMQLFQEWVQTLDSNILFHVLDRFYKAVDGNCEVVMKEMDQCVISLESGKKDLIVLYPVQKNTNVVATKPSHLFIKYGLYIVFGGRKGLGWETIKYLAQNGAKHIGVISRSIPTDEMLKTGNELQREYECQLYDVQANTCIMEELKVSLFAVSRRSGCPIKGMFYGAALTSDSIIPDMTRDRFKIALSPKVAGVWNLYQLTKHLDLDMFVMYSSVASLFGNPGQTNYCAGNAFMDAVALYRRLQTGVGQTICFGLLNVGIAANTPRVVETLRKFGFLAMETTEIEAILSDALLSDHPIMAYSKFSWIDFVSYASNWPDPIRKTYQLLFEKRAHYITDTRASNFTSNQDDRSSLISIVKAVLLLKDDEVNRDQTLPSLGADSQDIQQIYNVLLENGTLDGNALSLLQMKSLSIADINNTLSAEKQ